MQRAYQEEQLRCLVEPLRHRPLEDDELDALPHLDNLLPDTAVALMAGGGYFKSRMAAKDPAEQPERYERRAEAQELGLQLIQSLPWDMATVLVMCGLHG